MTKTVNFPLLLAIAFFIQFPLVFLAIAIGTMARSFEIPIGNVVPMLLSPGIAYFWAEGLHSRNHLGLLIGIIVNTIYFVVVIFLGAALLKRLRKPVAAGEQMAGPEQR